MLPLFRMSVSVEWAVNQQLLISDY